MERQLELNLATEQERVASVLEYLQPVELAPRHRAALALVVSCGEVIQVGTTRAIRWQASKGRIGEKARKNGVKTSVNTFLRAVEELESRRVVGVLRNTRPWTYVVSLAALGQLPTAPADPVAAIEALPCFRPPEPPEEVDRTEFRSAPVSSGQFARVRESNLIQNPCPTVYRDQEPCARMVDRGLTDRMVRPWDRQCGLVDADLVRAVERGELDPVRRLWREAKMLEWVGGSEDELLRFLTIVHHCATSTGINRSRMGVLVARVRRGCDVAKIPHRSEDWAAGVIRQAHRLPEMAEVAR
jgi:hypothetical protein